MAKWKKRVKGSPAQIGQPYKERERVQHGSARRKASGTELAPQNRGVDSMKKPRSIPSRDYGEIRVVQSPINKLQVVVIGGGFESYHTYNKETAEKMAAKRRKLLAKRQQKKPVNKQPTKSEIVHYTKVYPEYTRESVVAVLRELKASGTPLSAPTVDYHLKEKRFGGLGKGKKKNPGAAAGNDVNGWKSEPHPELKDEVAFWRNRELNGFVAVHTVQKGAPAWSEKATRYSGKFQVEINTGWTLETRYFNTPEEAIRFSRNWMAENKTRPGAAEKPGSVKKPISMSKSDRKLYETYKSMYQPAEPKDTKPGDVVYWRTGKGSTVHPKFAGQKVGVVIDVRTGGRALLLESQGVGRKPTMRTIGEKDYHYAIMGKDGIQFAASKDITKAAPGMHPKIPEHIKKRWKHMGFTKEQIDEAEYRGIDLESKLGA